MTTQLRPSKPGAGLRVAVLLFMLVFSPLLFAAALYAIVVMGQRAPPPVASPQPEAAVPPRQPEVVPDIGRPAATARADHPAPDAGTKVRAESMEERVRRLWEAHGKNFAYVDGGFYRISKPPDKLAFRVVQVIDEHHFLVKNVMTSDAKVEGRVGVAGPVMLVTGPSYELIDDRRYSFSDLVCQRAGTYSYTAVLGDKRTVPKLIAYKTSGLTISEFQELLATGETNLGPDHVAIAKANEERQAKQLAEEQSSGGVSDAVALVKRDKYEDAKARLEKVIHDFPATQGARDAAKLLENVNDALTPEGVKKRAVEAARKREEAKKLAEEEARRKEEEARRKAEEARQEAEATAARQLKLAKRLFNDAREARLDGKREEAEKLREEGAAALRKVVDLYPNTKAAEEAMALLEK